jgi:hypothetical protein
MEQKEDLKQRIQFTEEEKGAIIFLVIIVLVALLLTQGNKSFIVRKTTLTPSLPNLNLAFEELPTIQVPENSKNQISYREALSCLNYLKNCIEHRGCHVLFHCKPFKEKHLHCLFDLACRDIKCDINKEVNNGRGAVDFKISMGKDQTLVEFKMASNPHLKRNLKNQLSIYAKANNDPEKFIVIVYKTLGQGEKVDAIIRDLNLSNHSNLIVINARKDDKQPASIAS